MAVRDATGRAELLVDVAGLGFDAAMLLLMLEDVTPRRHADLDERRLLAPLGKNLQQQRERFRAQ